MTILRGLKIDCAARVAIRLRWAQPCVAMREQVPVPETGGAARDGIGRWLDYYNRRRPHSALGDRTPDEAYGIEIDLENLAA